MLQSKMSRSLFIVLLIIVLLFTACSSNSSDSESTDTTNNAEANQQDGEGTVENTPLYKMEPAVEIRVIKAADTFFGYSENQTPSDNLVYDTWEKTMGIKFINKIETATEALNQQVKLAIMSNDLPDVVAANSGDYDQMIKGDMLVDLKPYIDKYMDPAIYEKLNAFNGKLFAPVTRGEAIYALPATSNVEGALRTMWIRKDWLEKVGRDVPKTMEEVVELAIAFTKEDPDGNGQNDTWGLPIDKNIRRSLLNTYEIIANAYGYYPTRTILDANGKITMGSFDPGLKEVLEILNRLHKEGAIDPEFASKDFMQADEGIAKGKYGLWLGVFWKPVDPGMQETYKNGVEWIAAPIPASSKVGVYKPFVQFPANAFYGVRKGYENPEALIVAVNNYLNADITNKDGFQFNMLELGKNEELRGIPINNWAVLQWQDPTYFSSSPLKKALNDPDFDPANPAYQIHGQAYDLITGRNGSEPWQQKQFSDIFLESIAVHEGYPQENYVFDQYYGAPTESMSKLGSIVDKLEEEALIRIISGIDPVSSYDSFIEEFKNTGASKIVEEMNQVMGK